MIRSAIGRVAPIAFFVLATVAAPSVEGAPRPVKVARGKGAPRVATAPASAAKVAPPLAPARVAPPPPPPPSAASTTSSSTSLPAVTLVDCLKPKNDVHCLGPGMSASSILQPGGLGKGPALAAMPSYPQFGEGFVEGGSLILAGNTNIANVNDPGSGGFVMKIDLRTGDRTVVSGKYVDPARGAVTVGAGDGELAMHGVRAVKPLPGGKYVAYVGDNPPRFLSIDPSTGNRALIFRSGDSCDLRGTAAKMWPMTVMNSRMATAADGTIYFAASSPNLNGRGIVRVRPGSPKCEVVSFAGDPARGAGPDFVSNISSIALRGDKLIAQTGQSNSLMQVDLATGDRLRVSGSASGFVVGAGTAEVGAESMFVQGDRAYTFGQFVGPGWLLTEVDLRSGARTDRLTGGGPSTWGTHRHATVYGYPNGQGLLLVADEKAVLVFDPATGNSNNLSY